MTNQIGWAGRLRGLFSDKGGPWGPSGGGGKKPPRASDPKPDQQGPWSGGPERPSWSGGGSGIGSLEELLRQGRARFGGGGNGGSWDGGSGRGRNFLFWGLIGFVLLWLF